MPNSLSLISSASVSSHLAHISLVHLLSLARTGSLERVRQWGKRWPQSHCCATLMFNQCQLRLSIPHLVMLAKYYTWWERIESFPDKRTYPNNKYLPRLSSAVERAIRGSSFNPLVCSYGRQIDPLWNPTQTCLLNLKYWRQSLPKFLFSSAA